MYCEHWGDFYELGCGPIGLGVTGEVAKIFMEDFQERAMERCVVRPRKWIWYVDDSETVMKSRGDGQSFYEHLNAVDRGVIAFTMEFECLLMT